MTAAVEADQRALVVLELVITRGPEGFSIHELMEALLAAKLTIPERARVDAGFAIRYLRMEQGAQVIVYSARTRRYRSALTPEEAAAWLLSLLRQVYGRATNLRRYVENAREQFMSDDARVNEALDDVCEQLRRTTHDADRAARMVAAVAIGGA